MGNKPGRKRKHFLFHIAVCWVIVAGAGIISCAPIQERITTLKSHYQLEQYRQNMAAGFFTPVIQHAEKALAESETRPPADVALYALGEVYAHHGFEGRDYEKSRHYFERLIANFPVSPLTSEARMYISLFDTIEAGELAAAAARQTARETSRQAEAAPGKKSVSLVVPRPIVEDQDFARAVQRNEKILAEARREKPADEALYRLGLIYAHVDNPAKDYKKSQYYFQTLTRQFPESEFAEEARIWLGLFDTIEKIQQIDIEIEQQKKQLTR